MLRAMTIGGRLPAEGNEVSCKRITSALQMPTSRTSSGDTKGAAEPPNESWTFLEDGARLEAATIDDEVSQPPSCAFALERQPLEQTNKQTQTCRVLLGIDRHGFNLVKHRDTRCVIRACLAYSDLAPSDRSNQHLVKPAKEGCFQHDLNACFLFMKAATSCLILG
jgi:hypothetical protein